MKITFKMADIWTCICKFYQKDESFEEFFKSSHYWSALHFSDFPPKHISEIQTATTE